MLGLDADEVPGVGTARMFLRMFEMRSIAAVLPCAMRLHLAVAFDASHLHCPTLVQRVLDPGAFPFRPERFHFADIADHRLVRAPFARLMDVKLGRG